MIRQRKYSATVVGLDSLFAHGDGIPAATFGTTETGWPLLLS
jgi:hypothetical protein